MKILFLPALVVAVALIAVIPMDTGSQGLKSGTGPDKYGRCVAPDGFADAPGASYVGDDGKVYWCHRDGQYRLTVPLGVTQHQPKIAGGVQYDFWDSTYNHSNASGCQSDGIDWRTGKYNGDYGMFGVGMKRESYPNYCWSDGRWHDRPER